MTIAEYLDHGRQALADNVAFIRAKNDVGKIDVREFQLQLDAYEAGFLAAWRAALSDISLHGTPKP